MVAVAALVFGSVAPGAWAQPQTAELRGNRWIEVPAPSSSPATDAATDRELAQVEQLVAQRRHGQARARLVRWFKRHGPTAPARDRALYLMAQAQFQKGDRIKSFYYLDQLLDEYPDSALFFPALEMQFRIADAYLDGHKNRFLGMPIVEAYDEAVDMLYRIQSRAPGSQIAERALLRTADHYYASADYDLASDAYAAFSRSYPRSPATPRVRLRQAFANYAQFRGLRFDATPLVDARAQLSEIVAQHPELAQEEGLPEVIERIDRTFAEKLYVTADFYRRTSEPRAAAYTYKQLISAYPDTPEAQKAQQALARLPESARRSAGVEEPTTTKPARASMSSSR